MIEAKDLTERYGDTLSVVAHLGHHHHGVVRIAIAIIALLVLLAIVVLVVRVARGRHDR
jgi:hypothetical protein